MIYARAADDYLKTWANSPHRKPLILRGARQVGKSTLVRRLGEEFDLFLELNLERDTAAVQLFEKAESVHSLLEVLKIEQRLERFPNRTLLFLDEIQNSPRAIWLIRYFYEERPDLHVIAAGSLLEFALGEVKSFPVGRVQFYYLHPLQFTEFLQWKGEDFLLAQYRTTPLNPAAHEALFTAYHEYLIVGGMPEAVQRFVETGSMGGLPEVYDGIWASYLDDVEKYVRNTGERNLLRFVLQVAPYQSGRITFRHFGESNYGSREVGQALRLLAKARVLRLLYPTTRLDIPLTPDFKKSPKLQFLDTGLLIHTLDVRADLIDVADLQGIFNGRLIEQHLIQEFAASFVQKDYPPRFWVRQKGSSNAEVDLVYQHGTLVIPVEIKSGPQGRLRSLHQFIERSPHPYAVRFLRNTFSVERHITPGGKDYYLMNLPYFLMGQLGEYIAYFLAKYAAL
ncbi:MAG: AAA family ATPase [Bacteroidota bacterium]